MAYSFDYGTPTSNEVSICQYRVYLLFLVILVMVKFIKTFMH